MYLKLSTIFPISVCQRMTFFFVYHLQLFHQWQLKANTNSSTTNFLLWMEERCKSLSPTYVLPFKTLKNVLCAALQYVMHATTDVSMYNNDTKVCCVQLYSMLCMPPPMSLCTTMTLKCAVCSYTVCYACYHRCLYVRQWH